MLPGVAARARALRTELRDNLGQGPLDARTTTVLVLATVLLTTFHYWGKAGAFWHLPFAEWAQLRFEHEPRWRGILPYAWWGASSIWMRVLIPLLVMWMLFRDRPRDFGLTFRGTLRHLPAYLGLYAFMLPFLVLASTWTSFQRTYPFWDGARAGGVPFWTFEGLYALQFIGVEFFFRGFLTFTLCRRFGYHGLLLATVPYVMIHFNKPVAETLGALVAGCVLGYLALRSRTIVPGILLHGGIALTMDLLAMRATAGG